jgi:hypothetical protein
VLTQIYLALFLTVVSPAMLAAGGAQTTEVEGVIRQFHQALERHDVAAIQAYGRGPINLWRIQTRSG